MDKLMNALMNGFTAFFDWWGDLTGLGTKSYFDGKLIVNWKVISVPLLLIALMVVFLPGGLLF
jgi:hypothetical protein